MKTLSQLLNNTPSDVIARSKDVTANVKRVSRAYKRELQAIVVEAACNARTDRTIYDVSFEIYPTEIHKNVFQIPSNSHPVWVKCSCPYFLFHCEYALSKVGSSEIDYSNGKRPVITNPKQIPFFCKHLFRAAPQVLAAAQKLAASETGKTYRWVK